MHLAKGQEEKTRCKAGSYFICSLVIIRAICRYFKVRVISDFSWPEYTLTQQPHETLQVHFFYYLAMVQRFMLSTCKFMLLAIALHAHNLTQPHRQTCQLSFVSSNFQLMIMVGWLMQVYDFIEELLSWQIIMEDQVGALAAV